MQLTAEETVLLLTARPYLSEVEDGVLRRLLATSLNWPYVLWRAENTRTLSTLRYHAERAEWGSAPRAVRCYLDRWQQVADVRTRALYRELGLIVRAFSEAAVDYHLLKGAVIGPLYYPTPLLRPMQDLDVMVHPSHALKARSILFDLGYAHGIWTPNDNRFRRMNPKLDFQKHELPSMTKLVETPSPLGVEQIPASWRAKHIKCFVDPARTMTVPVFVDLHLNLSAGMDLADVWRGAQHELVFGHLLRVQSPTTMLWFVAARLYHEAFEYGTIKLNMFGDIDTILRRRAGEIDWRQLLEVVKKYGMTAPLYYVLAQTSAITGAEVPRDVIDALRPLALDVPVTNDWGDLLPKMFSRAELHAVAMA